jgi:hypothetical protein
MQRIIALAASAGVCLLAVRAMRIRHSATALAA